MFALVAPYTLLENSIPKVFGLPGDGVTASITSNSIAGVFSTVWLIGITMCVFATMGVLAVNALKLQAADSGNKELQIKENVKRAVYGIIMVLGLWLLLDTVNPELLRGEITLTKVDASSSSGSTPSETPTTEPTNPGDPKSETNVRKLLSDIPIKVNYNTPCTAGQTTGCTNVAGMRDETIDLLKQLRQNCQSCDITITGGTEPGHASHGPGLKPVDLRLADDLSALIRTSGSPLSPIPKRSDGSNLCYAAYTYLGWRFCDEAPPSARHWHVYQP